MAADSFASRRNPGKTHSFDDPAPTVQRFGIGDERPTSLMFGSARSPLRRKQRRPRSSGTANPGKPPYRVPTLEEIAAVPRNGLTVMSTFSGAGGSCLGFEWAGYRPLLACEFVPAAVETYKANHPGVPVWDEDIRELTAERALELMGIAAGELDVLEGSPPCESFSTAGKLSAGWGKTRDYSDGKQQVMDDLFFEFARLLDGVRPRAFVAENVSGLVKGVSKGYFKRIHAALEECRYVVRARLLDAQWLGVPQRRQRVIFVGMRADLGLEPAFPAPLPYRYSIRDALSGVEAVIGGWPRITTPADEPSMTIGKGGYSASGEHEVVRVMYENGGGGGASRDGLPEEDLDAPARTIVNSHAAATHFKVERKHPEPYPPQEVMVEHGKPLRGTVRAAWEQLGPGESDDHYYNLVRPDGEEPSPTVTRVGGTNLAAVSHPDDPRKFSIAELRRLCGFPDDFALTGTYAQQWERLGNSVPPPMMFHIAAAVAARLA